MKRPGTRAQFIAPLQSDPSFILLMFIIGSNTHQLKLGSQAGGRAIRRGEGGGWGVGRAFMVARGGDGTVFHQAVSQRNRTRATIKALPATPHRPRPYGW